MRVLLDRIGVVCGCLIRHRYTPSQIRIYLLMA